MAEYIDKKAADNALTAAAAADSDKKRRTWAKAIGVLHDVPAADVVPVVRGEWKWQEEWETFPNTDAFHLRRYGWYCTNCGIELGEYLTKAIGRRVDLDDDFSKPDLKYCPNCGCRMLGGDKDDPISDKQRD